MPIKATGYGTKGAKDKLAPMIFERRDPRPDDVVADILYCGVCHTDIHNCHDDWGGTSFPVVPGHEIIAKVTKVGPDVKKFKIGDIIGVGYLIDTCRHCDACKSGNEQYCKKGVATCGGKDRETGESLKGGYSNCIVVPEHYALHVPDGMDLKAAAPLLCAGATTWSPLRHWKVGPKSSVGVVGLGGLGHMALKLAKALGAYVALFTHTKNKKKDGEKLGADEVIISSDDKEMEKAVEKFDLIIDTVPCAHDINPYLPTLKLNGTLVLVGHLGKVEPPLSTLPLILGRRSVAGSVIGSVEEIQELFDFCAKKKVLPDVEIISIDYINKAFERLEDGDVKYRFVIDMKSLEKSNKEKRD